MDAKQVLAWMRDGWNDNIMPIYYQALPLTTMIVKATTTKKDDFYLLKGKHSVKFLTHVLNCPDIQKIADEYVKENQELMAELAAAEAAAAS